jgi:hypothetical protein
VSYAYAAAAASQPQSCYLLPSPSPSPPSTPAPPHRHQPPTNPPTGTLELTFSANPYFTNTKLAKKYTYRKLTSRVHPGIAIVASEAEPVSWQAGRDLTVKQAPEGAKPRPAASFFCLFKKGAVRRAFNITGEADDVLR